MDLKKHFATDATLTREGAWVQFGDARIKIRAANTDEFRTVYDEVSERYRPQLQIGGPVAVRARMDLRREVAARYTIAEWDNITVDGVALDWQKYEDRLKAVSEYDVVLLFVEANANDLRPYQLKDEPKVQQD